MESRKQGSRPRPRTQKKSEAKAKAKDSLPEDRHSRGQGQECSRPRPRTKDTSASALQKKKKKGLHKNFSGDLRKKCYGGLEVKSPAAGQFLYVFGKKSYFIPIGSHFTRVHSHLKELDLQHLKTIVKKFICSILLLLAIKFQNTFKILHYGLKF